MQFPPWLLSFVFGTALIASSGSVLAETEAETDSGQHQALDDAALEEKYGIKAGSVQRDEQPSNVAATDEASAEEGADNGSEDTEGGTGGTGSAEDAIENGEDEQSNDDNE